MMYTLGIILIPAILNLIFINSISKECVESLSKAYGEDSGVYTFTLTGVIPIMSIYTLALILLYFMWLGICTIVKYVTPKYEDKKPNLWEKIK